MDLTLATREADGRAIVAVGGEIDVYTAPKLRDKITELVGDGVYNIVIDMEAVEFLDSTGLGVLVGGLKKVRAHDGSLELVCTQDRLLKIFRITGLAKVFVIHDSARPVRRRLTSLADRPGAVRRRRAAVVVREPRPADPRELVCDPRHIPTRDPGHSCVDSARVRT